MISSPFCSCSCKKCEAFGLWEDFQIAIGRAHPTRDLVQLTQSKKVKEKTKTTDKGSEGRNRKEYMLVQAPNRNTEAQGRKHVIIGSLEQKPKRLYTHKLKRSLMTILIMVSYQTLELKLG